MACNNKAFSGKLILLCLLLFSCGFILLLASTPPVSRDALVHHLAVPKLYLQQGTIYEIPNLVFSYYPMNLDLLYLIPLYFGNDILPKYIHCLFGFGSAALIFVFLKKRLSSIYGLSGALFFLTIPIIIKLSITVYVDLGLIFFSLSSLLLITSWLEKHQIRHLILAGICCGLAIGTKYNGLITFLILSLSVPFFYSRTAPINQFSYKKAFTYTIFFCAFVVLVCGGWFLRNYLWTGNPTYPLYEGFFNPSSQPATTTGNNSAVHSIFAMRQVLYGETWWEMALLPIRIFFEGTDNNPRLFDGKLNPFLLFLPLLTLFVPQSDKKEQLTIHLFTFFSILYFLFAFFSSALRIRYLSPIIPPLVILSMFGLHNFSCIIKNHFNNSRISKIFISIIVMAMLLPNYIYLYQQFKEIQPIQYLSGQISRDAYLTKHRPDYATKAYANKHLPDNAKILCIFLAGRGYYLDRPHFFDEPGNSSQLFKHMQEHSLTATLSYFQQEKITHLLIRDDLLLKTINSLTVRDEINKWKLFFYTFTEQLYTKRGYSLYKLKLPNNNR